MAPPPSCLLQVGMLTGFSSDCFFFETPFFRAVPVEVFYDEQVHTEQIYAPGTYLIPSRRGPAAGNRSGDGAGRAAVHGPLRAIPAAAGFLCFGCKYLYARLQAGTSYWERTRRWGGACQDRIPVNKICNWHCWPAGGDQLLGTDPETGRGVRLRLGPYGPYLQLEAAPDGSERARNVALPPAAATSGMTLQVHKIERCWHKASEWWEREGAQRGAATVGRHLRHDAVGARAGQNLLLGDGNEMALCGRCHREPHLLA